MANNNCNLFPVSAAIADTHTVGLVTCEICGVFDRPIMKNLSILASVYSSYGTIYGKCLFTISYLD